MFFFPTTGPFPTALFADPRTSRVDGRVLRSELMSVLAMSLRVSWCSSDDRVMAAVVIIGPFPGALPAVPGAPVRAAKHGVLFGELVSVLTVRLTHVIAAVLLRRSDRFQMFRANAVSVATAVVPDVINRQARGYRTDPQFVGVPVGEDSLGFPFIISESEISVAPAALVDLSSPQPTGVGLLDLSFKALSPGQPTTSQTRSCLVLTLPSAVVLRTQASGNDDYFVLTPRDGTYFAHVVESSRDESLRWW